MLCENVCLYVCVTDLLFIASLSLCSCFCLHCVSCLYALDSDATTVVGEYRLMYRDDLQVQYWPTWVVPDKVPLNRHVCTSFVYLLCILLVTEG